MKKLKSTLRLIHGLPDRATSYEFILAKDSQFTEVVVAMTGTDALATTVWRCDRDLEYSITYFWKVRAASANSYSQWGAGIFTTETAPSAAQQTPTSSPSFPPPAPATSTPLYVYGIIGIGVLLVVSLLVLIIRSGRNF